MAIRKTIKRMMGIGEKGIPGTFSRLLTLTSDAVFVFDGMGVVLLANGEAGHLLGMASADLVGKSVGDVFVSPTGERSPEGTWPFPMDGSLVAVLCLHSDGSYAPVGVRCDSVNAPGETYLLVVKSLDEERSAALEHERLVDELSQANHRLSGTLKIVLETLDTHDVDTLFDDVLEELRDTMEASGTILYVAEGEGFRQRGATTSLQGMHIPQYLPLGKGVATLATRAGHALRLDVAGPDTESLRSGSVTTREVFESSSMQGHRISARLLPPFMSFICVPVWFGERVIAIIEVGWTSKHAMQRDDARLLDAVAQYLSVQLASAFSSLKAQREAQLNQVVSQIHDKIRSSNGVTRALVEDIMFQVADELGATALAVSYNQWQKTSFVHLPGTGDMQLPFDLDALEQGHMEDGVAVVPLLPSNPLSKWLEEHGEPSVGALSDLGVISETRCCCLFLRDSFDEPLEPVELTFLHRLSDEIREAVAGVEARAADTRISQALQSGMRNELQTVEGITARGLYSSATAAAFVGGDFYDLIRLPGRKACVILGDVSGKGVEAASVSAAVKTALEAYAWEGLPPAHMVSSLNEFLMGFSRLETFATLFVGIVDLSSAKLTYCSAGHPPALLLRAATGELETLGVQSGVVGAFHEMAYHDGEIGLGVGDMLLLYTDGVTEARDPKGAFFGEEGLRDAVMRESGVGVDLVLGRLLETIDQFTGRHLDDDVAMIALRLDEVGRRSCKASPEASHDKTRPAGAKRAGKSSKAAAGGKSPAKAAANRNAKGKRGSE